MPGVRIVTDSSCDIRPDLATKLDITVVPLTIRIGGDEYTDGIDLTPEDFYKKMASSPTLPETAAPSPGSFEAAFTSCQDAGADAVVCLNISSKLSATMQSAATAAAGLEGDIDVRVIDSSSITYGLGNQVELAAAAAADGAGVDDVVALVEELKSRTRVFGALDTLENLKKGGRIGGATAMLGSMLSIKPLVDLTSGAVEEAGRARTRRKSLAWLREKIVAAGPAEHLAVMHANAPDVGDFLELLQPDHPADAVHVDLIGPVIGTHGGAGIIGVCFLTPG
jgi:DegV family protein with EDD domain